MKNATATAWSGWTIEHVEWLCRKPELLERFAIIIQDIVNGNVQGEYKKALITARLVIIENEGKIRPIA